MSFNILDIQQVCIEKNSYLDLDVESLIKPLGGFKNFIEKGERVLLKTNLLNASEPNKQVVTNPAVIRAIAKAVIKLGGIPYIGDSPSGQFNKRRLEKVYKKADLIKLSNELGIELNYDTTFKKIDINEGKKLKKSLICSFVLDADKIIAIPKLKTHSFMIMTLATKIMFGAVPGLTKVRYHSTFFRRKAFSDMLLDINSIVKPNLIIMDGITAMQGDGPAGGTPIDLGILLASEDAVSMDLTVCKALKIEPLGVPILKQAKIRGLWPSEINYPILSPKDVEYDNFILPSTAGYLLTGKKTPSRSPVPTDQCTACGDCVKICPKNAIKIVDNKAKIDYSKCIKCYCCHEVCNYNAIKLEIIK